MGFPHAKRRITRDDKTGQIVECLEKTKVANLNVYSPNEEFDWRVSVNMEVPGTPQWAFAQYEILFNFGVCVL